MRTTMTHHPCRKARRTLVPPPVMTQPHNCSGTCYDGHCHTECQWMQHLRQPSRNRQLHFFHPVHM
jgi:hypothetical protein